MLLLVDCATPLIWQFDPLIGGVLAVLWLNLLASINDIELLAVYVLEICRVLLGEKVVALARSVLVFGVKAVAVLLTFNILDLLHLLVVVVGVFLKLVNGLLVHIRHVKIVHVEALELLQED